MKYVCIQNAINKYGCKYITENGLNVQNALPVQQRNVWKAEQQQDRLIISQRFFGTNSRKTHYEENHHAEQQLNPTKNPWWDNVTDTSSCVYFPLHSCCTDTTEPETAHTPAAEEEERGSEWVGERERERGSFISSHHPLSLLPLSVICLVRWQKNKCINKK